MIWSILSKAAWNSLCDTTYIDLIFSHMMIWSYILLVEDAYRATLNRFLQSSHHKLEMMSPYCLHESEMQYISTSHTHTYTQLQANIPENGFRYSGECGSPDTEKQPPTPPEHPPLQPTTFVSCSWAPNASPDPCQSRSSTTCWSKSSIDLKQLCAVEHYILIWVAWWL